jgi:hypothetical protein
LRVGHVARHIFECQPPPEKILHLADAIDDVVERLLGIGDRQEIVQVHAMDAGPAQMIGDPGRLHPVRQRLQPAEILQIERGGGRDRERHAMHYDGIAFADAVKDAQGLAAIDHVIFGDDLEPVDFRLAFEDLAIMLRPKTQAEAEKGRPVAVHRWGFLD